MECPPAIDLASIRISSTQSIMREDYENNSLRRMKRPPAVVIKKNALDLSNLTPFSHSLRTNSTQSPIIDLAIPATMSSTHPTKDTVTYNHNPEINIDHSDNNSHLNSDEITHAILTRLQNSSNEHQKSLNDINQLLTTIRQEHDANHAATKEALNTLHNNTLPFHPNTENPEKPPLVLLHLINGLEEGITKNTVTCIKNLTEQLANHMTQNTETAIIAQQSATTALQKSCTVTSANVLLQTLVSKVEAIEKHLFNTTATTDITSTKSTNSHKLLHVDHQSTGSSITTSSSSIQNYHTKSKASRAGIQTNNNTNFAWIPSPKIPAFKPQQLLSDKYTSVTRTQIKSWFISSTKIHHEVYSIVRLKQIISMPIALVNILDSIEGPALVRTWLENRNTTIRNLIPHIIHMFRLEDNEDKVHTFCDFLICAWACEIGYLLPHSKETHIHHGPLTCPICDPIYKHTIQGNSNIAFLHTSRHAPLPGDKLTHSGHVLRQRKTWNQLTIQEMYAHTVRMASKDLLHSIYEVVIHTLYYDSHIRNFPNIRNPRDNKTPITTPLLTGGQTIIRHDPEHLATPQVMDSTSFLSTHM